ncbi:hypothetical protein Tco_1419257 [Tanacetum coccineum]
MYTSSNDSTPTIKRKIIQEHLSKLKSNQIDPNAIPPKVLESKQANFHLMTCQSILNEESIDSGFARFNTIITSLKALDEGFSSKNYVRKFHRALRPKLRAKVTAIEESEDLSSLALDEFIGNLKVHEVVMEKGLNKFIRQIRSVESTAMKLRKSSDDETSTSRSDDEEYAMARKELLKVL